MILDLNLNIPSNVYKILMVWRLQLDCSLKLNKIVVFHDFRFNRNRHSKRQIQSISRSIIQGYWRKVLAMDRDIGRTVWHNLDFHLSWLWNLHVHLPLDRSFTREINIYYCPIHFPSCLFVFVSCFVTYISLFASGFWCFRCTIIDHGTYI